MNCKRIYFGLLLVLFIADSGPWALRAADTNAVPTLEEGWNAPPLQARLKAYWWWLNGNVTQASITSDLEEMKKHGFGGAVIMDANGANQNGNEAVPHGPTFSSPEWRELFKHALAEAKRLGLELSLNIQSGWNLGGPSVQPEDAVKKYVWSESLLRGGTNLEIVLPKPTARAGFYKDSFVIAWLLIESSNAPPPRYLKNWKMKALQEPLQPPEAGSFAAPLFEEDAVVNKATEADLKTSQTVDLTTMVSPEGKLKWKAPAGHWKVLRFGYTLADHCMVSTFSEGSGGYALDVYDAKAFQNYWDSVVEPLIQDATNYCGGTLKYLQTAGWEMGLANWSVRLPQAFQSRRGYSMASWMPVLTGRIVNSREESDRFLFDYRKTLSELAIDNHYRLFKENARKRGLQIHAQSGVPHATPIDAQRCLGMDDAPMGEFWAWSWMHSMGDENRFFVKQPASAAHTYGRKLVMAGGFKDVGPHWQESLWWNLKPSFERALCEGMNLLVWHSFVSSPDASGIPGQQYFAGTHLNPKVTWWSKSSPFFDYINRCQWMLQQGRFVADVAYYYGDHAPNFAQLKNSDPAHVLPGYDYDVLTAEALLQRATVQDGRIVLADGMSYRVLVLPEWDGISTAALKKISDLVHAGATVVGPKPTKGETLQEFRDGDKDIKRMAEEMWVEGPGKTNTIKTGDVRKVLADLFVTEDCNIPGTAVSNLDYIHRFDGTNDIYFLANHSSNALTAQVSFRVGYKAPELWNPVTGEHRFADSFEFESDRIRMPLSFEPFGSWFVLFRVEASHHLPVADSNGFAGTFLQSVEGPWKVHFDPKWGGPTNVEFKTLENWTARPEPGIHFYSGTAVYEKEFVWTMPREPGRKRFLEIGPVHEIAEVKLNGKSCGIVWCPPWRVPVEGVLQTGTNRLEIEVVNFWPNRLVGDAGVAPKKRLTHTNIRNISSSTHLMDSGLMGPVRMIQTPE